MSIIDYTIRVSDRSDATINPPRRVIFIIQRSKWTTNYITWDQFLISSYVCVIASIFPCKYNQATIQRRQQWHTWKTVNLHLIKDSAAETVFSPFGALIALIKKTFYHDTESLPANFKSCPLVSKSIFCFSGGSPSGIKMNRMSSQRGPVENNVEDLSLDLARHDFMTTMLTSEPAKFTNS